MNPNSPSFDRVGYMQELRVTVSALCDIYDTELDAVLDSYARLIEQGIEDGMNTEEQGEAIASEYRSMGEREQSK